VSYKPAQSMDVFRRLIGDAVTDCETLAEELKVSKSTVAKWAKKRSMPAG
jgi:predicted transcriptional regulator